MFEISRLPWLQGQLFLRKCQQISHIGYCFTCFWILCAVTTVEPSHGKLRQERSPTPQATFAWFNLLGCTFCWCKLALLRNVQSNVVVHVAWPVSTWALVVLKMHLCLYRSLGEFGNFVNSLFPFSDWKHTCMFQSHLMASTHGLAQLWTLNTNLCLKESAI